MQHHSATGAVRSPSGFDFSIAPTSSSGFLNVIFGSLAIELHMQAHKKFNCLLIRDSICGPNCSNRFSSFV
ncbi:hypothetical protein H920_12299 [Fukomys damarensis]|uniref:Uncharacterized protein n=1 Tax=Fukomys damarensis TaxID=885580 RepID=A0A091D7U4_FUKDA|nr:hypothetical protein H920_12299 [Fukomys damarensis]